MPIDKKHIEEQLDIAHQELDYIKTHLPKNPTIKDYEKISQLISDIYMYGVMLEGPSANEEPKLTRWQKAWATRRKNAAKARKKEKLLLAKKIQGPLGPSVKYRRKGQDIIFYGQE